MALPAQKVGFQPRSIKLLTIGQVLSALKSDFGDLTPSKLRFLEEQELVCPQRTASGYRKYTDLDVDRIRIILELQRDKYLPLKVIRQYLEDLEAGKNPSLPGSSSPVAEHLRISNKVKFTELDLSDAKQQRFDSLHACFTRELVPGARTVDMASAVLASPCDAIVGACGTVDQPQEAMPLVIFAKPAGQWKNGCQSEPPASSNSTLTAGSALSRLASTQPAEPPPVMM